MTDLTYVPKLLADIEVGTLSRSLAIAAVIVAPYAAYKIRKVRSARAAADRPRSDRAEVVGQEPAGPSLEALVGEIERLRSGVGEDGVTITVPHDVTVDGRAAPRQVVQAIVRDALRRSDLAPTAELDTGEATVIECRRVSAGRSRG